VVHTHRQRVLLPQVAPGLVDHRQAVGVGVLAEAHVGPHARHLVEHAGKVLGRRLRGMLEPAVGHCPAKRYSAPQRLQQLPAEQTPCTVIGVQQHCKPLRADLLHVDRREYGVEVGALGVRQGIASSQSLVTGPINFLLTVPGEDALARPLRDDPAFGREELEPVVLGRIMAGGDLDPAGGLVVADEDPQGGRSGDPRVECITADRAQTRLNRLGQHLAREPAVAGHDQGPRGAFGGKCGDIADRNLRRQALANYASQPRDADNRLFQARLLSTFAPTAHSRSLSFPRSPWERNAETLGVPCSSIIAYNCRECRE